jgi:hypothetical protein
MYRGSSGELRFTNAGASWICIDNTAIFVGSSGVANRGYAFSTTSDPYAATDFYLNRVASHVLAVQGPNATAMEMRVIGDGSTMSKYLSLLHNGTDSIISSATGAVKVTTGGLTIGSSGTNITAAYSASATLDFPSIAATGGTQDLTITVTGAATGDRVCLGLPAAPSAGVVFNAFVSAANTVTVRATNCTGGAIDPASASYSVQVFH